MRQDKYNLLLIGPTSAEKSTLVNRYAEGPSVAYAQVRENDPEEGAHIVRKIIELKETKITLYFTVAAINDNKNTVDSYLNGKDAVLLVYSNRRDTSLNDLKQFYEAHKQSFLDKSITLVGTHLEEANTRVVEDAKIFANQIDAKFFKCSAKEGASVENLFSATVNTIYDQKNNNENLIENNNKSSIFSRVRGKINSLFSPTKTNKPEFEIVRRPLPKENKTNKSTLFLEKIPEKSAPPSLTPTNPPTIYNNL